MTRVSTRRLLLLVPVGLLGLCGLPLTWPAGIVPAVAAVAAVAVAVVARSARPAVAVALLSLLADVVYQGPPQPPALWAPFEFTALTVLLVVLARRGPALAVAVVGVAVVALPVRIALHVPGNRVEATVLLVAAAFPVAVCAAGAGLYLRLGDHRRRLAEERARREHRLDLARDLHDLVAHEVTGIVVAAQAAGLPDIEAAGLRALDAMDRMVGTLRGPVSQRVHGIADLPDVVRRFSSTGPITARLDMTGMSEMSAGAEAAVGKGEGAAGKAGPAAGKEEGAAGKAGPAAGEAKEPAGQVGAEVGNTAYHVVVEALTNVRRHAPTATEVMVAVRHQPGRIELQVTDNGTGRKPAGRRSGGGTGLAGLHERVIALGGDLTAGPHPTGWQVTCHLPAG
ncbi:ATP-binding protein [Dactylosporangium sp. NPDC050688]|uniref:sensor histidine kinase n=1 Tax=Dactylosporangium sp. NPDC050688 TaxID=3157217 RepID=UPI0033E83DF9